jgi:transposase
MPATIVRTPRVGGRGRRKQTRTFASFTGSLQEMADWFAVAGVTEVAMEATGSYRKPVWYVLEERAFELKLVNTHHVKILPGRKSDVRDAEWLAELRGHGLRRGQLRASAGEPTAAGPDPVSRRLADNRS